ncbi:hypothetical protein NIIDMKKI_41460 [Mycobacterium kansasii]|uniref:Uncharacterized protein n=1 Tax=Mycobacterium kansasii TaxID=1768 RepID=A0A7G1IDR5_MYCKA|nr:hypothetical protein NIIDMKKI_41460 [Mycobacterium kansasii]
MTSDENTAASGPVPTPAPVAPPPAVVADPGRERRRFSLAALIGAGVAGLILGAAGSVAAIAFAWLISVGPPPPPRDRGPCKCRGKHSATANRLLPVPAAHPDRSRSFPADARAVGSAAWPTSAGTAPSRTLRPGPTAGAPGQPPGLPPSMQTSPTPRP